MKLESLTSTGILASLRNNPRARALALLVQTAFIDELDWNLELKQKDGFIYGELKQENSKPHGDIIVFVSGKTLYLINDANMFNVHTIPEIMNAHSNGFIHNVAATPEWAAKFVREFHTG